MTATFTMAELHRQGFVLRGDQLVRFSVAGEAALSDESIDGDELQEGTWKETQRRCREVFVDAGCEVYWLSQARKSGQTPGLPDLIVFGPPGAPFLIMWESKHGQGRLSDAQRKFALHCQRTRTRYFAGSPAIARRLLKRLLAEFREGAPRSEDNAC